MRINQENKVYMKRALACHACHAMANGDEQNLPWTKSCGLYPPYTGTQIPRRMWENIFYFICYPVSGKPHLHLISQYSLHRIFDSTYSCMLTLHGTNQAIYQTFGYRCMITCNYTCRGLIKEHYWQLLFFLISVYIVRIY